MERVVFRGLPKSPPLSLTEEGFFIPSCSKSDDL
mgnify:CR=1 FL=1